MIPRDFLGDLDHALGILPIARIGVGGPHNRAPADGGGIRPTPLRPNQLEFHVMLNQPRPVYAQAANPNPPDDEEASRLLRLWVELTWRVASAAAHNSSDEESLRNLQLQVEDAITDRVPDSEALLAELWVWESTLLHSAETPPETCLICRKASLGLPADLPLPATIGGSR